MYNLYVGGAYDVKKYTWTAYGDEATGKQDENMRGFIYGLLVANGTTPFSTDEKKGNNYSDYSGSLVEEYVNNYKTILESDYGVKLIEARLITKEELSSEKIGCKANIYTCEGAPSFIKANSYWTMSTDDTKYLYYVHTDNQYDFDQSIYNDDQFGVRPVIIIPKSDIVVS